MFVLESIVLLSECLGGGRGGVKRPALPSESGWDEGNKLGLKVRRGINSFLAFVCIYSYKW